MENTMLMETIIPNRWHDRRNAHLPPDGRHIRRVYVHDHRGGTGSAAGGRGLPVSFSAKKRKMWYDLDRKPIRNPSAPEINGSAVHRAVAREESLWR